MIMNEVTPTYYRPSSALLMLQRLRHRCFPPKSNLVAFAEAELARLKGDGEDDDGMQEAMNKHILRMVRTFSREGHSGFSAGYAVSVLQKLLRYEPLGPITGEDGEWTDISPESGEPMWQNKRCSHVFKDGSGRAYDINGRVFVEADGCAFTGTGSRVYVSFPYTPHREEVAVDEEGEPLEGPSRAQLAEYPIIEEA